MKLQKTMKPQRKTKDLKAVKFETTMKTEKNNGIQNDQ